MRHQPPSSELFSANRERLLKLLPKGSLAVIHSNDLVHSNGDGVLPYIQSSDFYYLSGITQEESVLLLEPDADEPSKTAQLFLLESDETTSRWDGAKLSKKEATTLSGIQTIAPLSELHRAMREAAQRNETIYCNSNEHPRAKPQVPSRDERFRDQYREQFPLHQYGRLAPLLAQLRCIKNEEEISLIEQACQITGSSFKKALATIAPEKKEYEIEAEFAAHFIGAGCSGISGFAYQPIVAGGGNSCVLHYVANSATLQDGDILLMDVGCQHSHYHSDMTRCVPVNGKFTQRQKDVYNAVLRVMREAEKLLRPGILIKDYHAQIGLLMQDELIGLGLIDQAAIDRQEPDKPAYKKYFPHGTSHHLGLDTHDVHPPDAAVEVGNVFTIEPGIYIPEENLGIRLENNYYIGETENRNLMADIPIEAEEIEDLMNI